MTSWSPLDLLTLSDDDQQVFRCLNKQPHLTIYEIANHTKLPVDEVEAVVNRLISQSRLVEQLKGDQRIFSVRFRRDPGRRVRNMPAGLLELYEQPIDTFLLETSLTVHLTPEERELLLAKSVAHKLLPDEVVHWQGKKFNHIGLLKSGLLKKSRLRGRRQVHHVTGYVRRSEWFGLVEILSRTASADTYTAVAESELLLWSEAEFLEFLAQSSQLSLAINRLLSTDLKSCQNQHIRGRGKLWAIESLERSAGATTIAVSLAIMASQNGLEGSQQVARVLLWNANGDDKAMTRAFGLDPHLIGPHIPGQENLISHQCGVDILFQIERSDYPAQVQLDILLTRLQTNYDYVICDTGTATHSEFTLRLRGQADTLITVTRQPEQAQKGLARWQSLQEYARPAQKRVLALNSADPEQKQIDPAFHLVIPDDKHHLMHAESMKKPVVETAAKSPFAAAMSDVYRRLSLTHSLGIFIPSTLDVDQAVDNREQVQSALSFLGRLFGGATSSEADGVWRSQDSGLVTEHVTIVRTFVSRRLLDRHLDDVISFATQLKQDMRQEAVAVDVDNQLILV